MEQVSERAVGEPPRAIGGSCHDGAASGPTPPAGPEAPVPRHRAVAKKVFVTLDPPAPAYVADHRIHGSVVVPAATWLELALAAGAEVLGQDVYVVEDASFPRSLPLHGAAPARVEIAVEPTEPARAAFTIHSDVCRDSVHARGALVAGAPTFVDPGGGFAQAFERRELREIDGEAYYRTLAEAGIEVGPSRRAVARAWIGGVDLAVLEIALAPEHRAACARHKAHPVLLDACIEALSVPALATMTGAHLPVAIERLALHRALPDRVFCRATVGAQGGAGSARIGDVEVYDDAGALVASILGVTLLPVGAEACTVRGLSVRHARVLTVVRSKTAEVLGLESTDPVDEAALFDDLGFDSLMAIDLRSALCKALGCSIAIDALTPRTTIASLAELLAGEAGAADRDP